MTKRARPLRRSGLSLRAPSTVIAILTATSCGFIASLSAQVMSAAPQAVLSDRPGKADFLGKRGQCHAAEGVVASRRTPAGWDEVLPV